MKGSLVFCKWGLLLYGYFIIALAPLFGISMVRAAEIILAFFLKFKNIHFSSDFRDLVKVFIIMIITFVSSILYARFLIYSCGIKFDIVWKKISAGLGMVTVMFLVLMGYKIVHYFRKK